MKRKEVRAAGPGGAASTEGLSKLPNLAEWMTTTAFDDGAPRQVPTITFFCQDGEWRASLKDREEGLCMFLNAPTWAELVKLINDMCMEEKGPWRHDGTPTRTRAKK